MPLNDGYVYREQIARETEWTALEYLSARYRHSSRETWAERFARGEVLLDDGVATGSERLRSGQILEWHRPPWEEGETPQSFELLYEDDALLAVVKPSGLPTLPAGGYLKNTLLHLLQRRWPEAVPLHRLGRATTGLVLVARTSEVASILSRAWREGAVEKHYRALASGTASEALYEIRAPIGLVPHPRLGEVYGVSAKGKPSYSSARVLERRADETLFSVHLHTGRPEQIRIHLAFIGHPLVGDPLFAAGGLPHPRSPGLPGDGGYLLHAESLVFTHPISGRELRLQAPPPPALRRSGE